MGILHIFKDHIQITLFFPLCSLERALFGVSILKLVITPENDVANKQYSLPNVIGLIATREWVLRMWPRKDSDIDLLVLPVSLNDLVKATIVLFFQRLEVPAWVVQDSEMDRTPSIIVAQQIMQFVLNHRSSFPSHFSQSAKGCADALKVLNGVVSLSLVRYLSRYVKCYTLSGIFPESLLSEDRYGAEGQIGW